MTITLATLADATPQQVFDQVARHLLTQNAKSIRDPNTPYCRYRGINNRQCAAGCLINDAEYDAELEGANWESLAADALVPRHHWALIADLQESHDSCPPDEWPFELRNVAFGYGLSAAVVDQLEA